MNAAIFVGFYTNAQRCSRSQESYDSVCEQELCMHVCVQMSVCLCVLCHLWAALVDFILSHKICIACVFMAQQTRSTDTDTAGDTDTDTNTVAKCDRVLSCWARQLPN